MTIPSQWRSERDDDRGTTSCRRRFVAPAWCHSRRPPLRAPHALLRESYAGWIKADGGGVVAVTQTVIRSRLVSLRLPASRKLPAKEPVGEDRFLCQQRQEERFDE